MCYTKINTGGSDEAKNELLRIELLIELFEIRFSFAILYQYFSYLIGVLYEEAGHIGDARYGRRAEERYLIFVTFFTPAYFHV